DCGQQVRIDAAIGLDQDPHGPARRVRPDQCFARSQGLLDRNRKLRRRAAGLGAGLASRKSRHREEKNCNRKYGSALDTRRRGMSQSGLQQTPGKGCGATEIDSWDSGGLPTSKYEDERPKIIIGG